MITDTASYRRILEVLASANYTDKGVSAALGIENLGKLRERRLPGYRLQWLSSGRVVLDFKSRIAYYVGLSPVICMLQLVEQTQCCRRRLIVPLDDGLGSLERQVQDEKNPPSHLT